MFKKFFHLIKDIIFKSVRFDTSYRSNVIVIIRTISTLIFAIKMHLSNAFNKVEKVLGTIMLGIAWLKI